MITRFGSLFAGHVDLQDRYPGLEEVHVGQVVGTDERVILEQLDRFATDVMPAFKRARVAV